MKSNISEKKPLILFAISSAFNPISSNAFLNPPVGISGMSKSTPPPPPEPAPPPPPPEPVSSGVFSTFISSNLARPRSSFFSFLAEPAALFIPPAPPEPPADLPRLLIPFEAESAAFETPPKPSAPPAFLVTPNSEEIAEIT